MKRLLSYLLISAMAALYSVPAEAAPRGRYVSLSYEADLSLRVVAPESHDVAVLYLPAITPALLINNDYNVMMSRQTFSAHAGRDGGYVSRSGWKLINTDPRIVRLQPTYFWSGNELGVRANVWNADRFLIVTFKVRY